jgi:hypothetical protein
MAVSAWHSLDPGISIPAVLYQNAARRTNTFMEFSWLKLVAGMLPVVVGRLVEKPLGGSILR